MKLPRVPQNETIPFSDEQIQSGLDGAPWGSYPDRNLTLILLLLGSGLRAGAVVDLNTSHVNREDGTRLVIGMSAVARSWVGPCVTPSGATSSGAAP